MSACECVCVCVYVHVCGRARVCVSCVLLVRVYVCA